MQSFGEDIWIFNFDVPMGPGMILPGRSLLYRENGRVMIVSPGPFTETDFQKIREWGEVVAIVSPNLMHSKWVLPTLQVFPDARFFRDPALLKKKPALEDRGEPYQKMSFLNFQGMEFLEVRGIPRAQECVFYFKKEHLLFITDLAFNIQHPKGPLTKLILTLVGTKGKLAVSRLISMLVKDRKVFQEDLRKMFDWNFDKVVMAHGEPLTADAKFQLEKALDKFLKN